MTCVNMERLYLYRFQAVQVVLSLLIHNRRGAVETMSELVCETTYMKMSVLSRVG